jgi:hypothetical protein
MVLEKEGNEFTFGPMTQATLVNMKNLAILSYRNTNLPCNYDYCVNGCIRRQTI